MVTWTEAYQDAADTVFQQDFVTDEQVRSIAREYEHEPLDVDAIQQIIDAGMDALIYQRALLTLIDSHPALKSLLLYETRELGDLVSKDSFLDHAKNIVARVGKLVREAVNGNLRNPTRQARRVVRVMNELASQIHDVMVEYESGSEILSETGSEAARSARFARSDLPKRARPTPPSGVKRSADDDPERTKPGKLALRLATSEALSAATGQPIEPLPSGKSAATRNVSKAPPQKSISKKSSGAPAARGLLTHMRPKTGEEIAEERKAKGHLAVLEKSIEPAAKLSPVTKTKTQIFEREGAVRVGPRPPVAGGDDESSLSSLSASQEAETDLPVKPPPPPGQRVLPIPPETSQGPSAPPGDPPEGSNQPAVAASEANTAHAPNIAAMQAGDSHAQSQASGDDKKVPTALEPEPEYQPMQEEAISGNRSNTSVVMQATDTGPVAARSDEQMPTSDIGARSERQEQQNVDAAAAEAADSAERKSVMSGVASDEEARREKQFEERIQAVVNALETRAQEIPESRVDDDATITQMLTELKKVINKYGKAPGDVALDEIYRVGRFGQMLQYLRTQAKQYGQAFGAMESASEADTRVRFGGTPPASIPATFFDDTHMRKMFPDQFTQPSDMSESTGIVVANLLANGLIKREDVMTNGKLDRDKIRLLTAKLARKSVAFRKLAKKVEAMADESNRIAGWRSVDGGLLWRDVIRGPKDGLQYRPAPTFAPIM